MPGRAIGLKWFGIDKKARTLTVNLSAPALVRPGATLKLPVKLGGLSPGEDAKIVVAAVDVGILNLTNYKPPAPDDYYLGQRRMSVGNPRPLRAVDRRHAGHTRPAQDRRRFRRRRVAGQSAEPETARVVFGNRHGRRRRFGRNRLRHSGVRRYRAGDGGGVDRDQARPCHDRCHGARSRGADSDAAALPAQWRSRHHEFRSRQRRRCAGRLYHQRQDRRDPSRSAATPPRR